MSVRRFLSRLRRRRAGDASGVAAVEFAVIAPVLTVLLAGAFDLGRALDQGIRLEAAARAGAQLVLLRPEATQDEVRCAVFLAIGASSCNVANPNAARPSWASNLTVSFDTVNGTTGGDWQCFCTNADGTVTTTVVVCTTNCPSNLPVMRTRRVIVQQDYAPLLPFTRFLTNFAARRDVVASL